MKALLEYLARGIVGAPERVVVRERDIRGVQTLHLQVAQEDAGRVIGRRGATAAALRTVLSALAQRSGERVDLEIM